MRLNDDQLEIVSKFFHDTYFELFYDDPVLIGQPPSWPMSDSHKRAVELTIREIEARGVDFSAFEGRSSQGSSGDEKEVRQEAR